MNDNDVAAAAKMCFVQSTARRAVMAVLLISSLSGTCQKSRCLACHFWELILFLLSSEGLSSF
jgi:hypothetical protein